MTKQGEKLLMVMNNSTRHMTAEEIFMLCKENDIKISFASVYRNLTNLLDEGLIRKVSIPGEPDRFDKTPTPHDHIFCSVCHNVADIDLGDMTTMLESKVGKHIDGYDLSIKYVCPECISGD
ncbi:MAG: transcriptional repressor [Clostridia bacterium]|nr:transcriptional repressor [Clostridia bacterium]